MTKNKVHVKIGGASYTIVTEDEAEYVEALADEISENMRAIINSNPSLSMTQAAVLVALNELIGTNLSDDELCDIGVKIGADVPFCIKGGTLLAQGIGDVLHKVKPLRKCFILIAKPDYGVNTGKAYALFDSNGKVHTPDKFGMLCAMQNRDLNEICAKMENVFEQFIEVPNKVDIKEVMRNNGALGVCMSGSGPTVFGIFDEKEKAEKAGDELAAYAKDIAVTTPVNKGCKIIK